MARSYQSHLTESENSNIEDPLIAIPTEDDWNQLFDKSRSFSKQAEERRERLSNEEYKRLRILAKKDLFFLSSTILGYDRLSKNLHGHMCRWHHATEHLRFREWLLPRNHFKSTVQTIAHAIQIALPDDAGDTVWPNCLGVDVRILICHEVVGKANAFLFEITSHFTNNPELMKLFPECIPKKNSERINKGELELPRDSHWKEATFSTMGVGGRSQGAHFNYLKLDDLIGDKARDSETDMQKAKDWIDNIQSFFSKFKDDKLDLIGTRWANDDLYDHFQERYGKALKIYRRRVEETNPSTGLKEPIFPEEVDSLSLSILRKNRKIFSAQYENDPDSGSTKFNASDITYFEWQDDRTVINFEKKRYVKLDQCNITFLIDPAVSGPTGFNVTATDQYGDNYLLKSIQEEWSPPQFTHFIFMEVLKWRPRTVAIEEVLFSELFRHWWMTEMKLRNFRFHITSVKVNQRTKEYRVDGLATPLSNHEIIFNEKYYSRSLNKEDSDIIYQVKKFGSIKSYHVLDALGYGPEVWIPATNYKYHHDRMKQEEERLKNSRCAISGYSKIG